MLFGDMFKRQRPRGLTWVPRHYDPDDDVQYDEMRRQTRIAFGSLRTPASRKRGLNAFVLLALVLMIGSIIFVSLRDKPMSKVSEVQIQAEDAAPTSQSARGEALIIERDTVKTNTTTNTPAESVSSHEVAE
jgi:hypothetical protein